MKEKDNDNSNPMIAYLYYNVSHLTLKIIKDEIRRVPKILTDPKNLCGHYIRTSHKLPCSRVTQNIPDVHPLKLDDVHNFWTSLEIKGVSGIGGQQSTQESYLQYQLYDLVGIFHEFSKSHHLRFVYIYIYI